MPLSIWTLNRFVATVSACDTFSLLWCFKLPDNISDIFKLPWNCLIYSYWLIYSNFLIYSEGRDCLTQFLFVGKVCLHSWEKIFWKSQNTFYFPQIAILSEDWIFKKLSSISLHPFPSVSGLKRYLFHTISLPSYIIFGQKKFWN